MTTTTSKTCPHCGATVDTQQVPATRLDGARTIVTLIDCPRCDRGSCGRCHHKVPNRTAPRCGRCGHNLRIPLPPG